MMIGKGSERSSSGSLQIGDELDYKEEAGHHQISIKADDNNIVSTFISSAVCKHCGRQFTSGRGLGGHMRTHNPNFPSLISTKSPSSSSFDDDDKRQLDLTQCLDNFSFSSLEEEDNENSPSLSHLLNRKGIINIRSDPSAEFEDFSAGVELDVKDAFYPINYKLRHNPKRSSRFTDQEFDLFTSNSTNSINGDAAPLHAASSGSSSVARKLFNTDSSIIPMSSSTPCPSKSPEPVGILCPVCCREFSSWKALCGHMRCHPDRNWRGIQPPTAIDSDSKQTAKPTPAALRRLNLQSSTSLDAEWKIDLTKRKPEMEDEIQVVICNSKPAESESEEPIDHNESDTSSAPKLELEGRCLGSSRFCSRITGKRTKRSRIHTITSLQKQQYCSNSSPLEVAAYGLLMLAYAGELEESSTREEDQSSSSDSKLNQEKDGLSMALFNHVGVLGEDALCEEGDQRLINSQAKLLSSSSSPAGRNGSTCSIYQCGSCKREFGSHQALGGHRASHRKVKGCFARTINNVGDALESGEEETTFITDGNIDGLLKQHSEEEETMKKPVMLLLQQESPVTKRRNINRTNATQNSRKVHVCSQCYRAFSSGQALGGHKRCHWIANKLAAVKKESNGEEEIPNSEVRSGARQFDFDLDLNLPAPLDDEKEENIPKAHPIASYTQQ